MHQSQEDSSFFTQIHHLGWGPEIYGAKEKLI